MRTPTSTSRAGRRNDGPQATSRWPAPPTCWDWASRTKSRYGAADGGQPSVQAGLLLKGAYTLSKAENETDDDGWATLRYSHPDSCSNKNFALATYDRTHVLQMGFVYELPFAKNSNSFLGQIVKNWQINGIGACYSGTPFDDRRHQPRPQLPRLQSGNGHPDQRPGRSQAHRARPAPRPTPGTTSRSSRSRRASNAAGFGNSLRNQFRTPSVWNVDLGLFRSFPMGRFRPEIRIEAQNVFNHTNWGRPNRPSPARSS